MAPVLRSVCLALAVAGLAAGAAAAAPAPAPEQAPCNNQTHHDDALVTYFLSGKDLRVRDVKEDPRGLTAVLETKLSDLSDAMPYIVHDGDVIKHGMVNAKRLVQDWQVLQAEASKEGRYANVVQPVVAQCYKEAAQAVTAFKEGFERDLSPMGVPPNAILFTEAFPNSSPVVDITDVRLEGDTVRFAVLFVRDPEMVPENVCHTRQGAGEQHHYHLPGACSAIETSLDWVEAAAGRAAGVDAAGPFAMSIKT